MKERVPEELRGGGAGTRSADAPLDKVADGGVPNLGHGGRGGAPLYIAVDHGDAVQLAVGDLQGDHLEHAHAEGVDVDLLRVVPLVKLRRHVLRRPKNRIRNVVLSHDRGEAQVSYLDLKTTPHHTNATSVLREENAEKATANRIESQLMQTFIIISQDTSRTKRVLEWSQHSNCPLIHQNTLLNCKI